MLNSSVALDPSVKDDPSVMLHMDVVLDPEFVFDPLILIHSVVMVDPSVIVGHFFKCFLGFCRLFSLCFKVVLHVQRWSTMWIHC